MPSTCCCVPKCSNRGGHVFPKDDKLKKKWSMAIKRSSDENKFNYWTPTKSSVVCKLHFTPSDYITDTSCGTTTLVNRLKKDAIPSVFPWNDEPSPSSMARKWRQARRHTSKKEMSREIFSENENNKQPFEDVGNEIIYVAEPINEIEIRDEINTENELIETGTQTMSWPSICIEKFENDPAGIMFYTGLQTYSDFQFVLATLGEAAHDLNYLYFQSDHLSVENKFFLTLIKLRQHKTNFELSRLFNISETSVINIWVTWINFMSRQWREISIWPSQDIVRYYSPQDFRTKFPKTRVIIDGTECPVKKPRSPVAQQSTFSTYKNRNTIKILVGSTPGGLISFVSPAYGGSTSDRQICERSNLIAICDRGDSIMADKGFNVQDIFAPYDVGVNIPTFFKKKNRLTGKIVMKDRRISSKRVHIERIIGLAKTFKVLKEPMNITETNLASEITFVCFMLCNFKNCIVPKHA